MNTSIHPHMNPVCSSWKSVEVAKSETSQTALGPARFRLVAQDTRLPCTGRSTRKSCASAGRTVLFPNGSSITKTLFDVMNPSFGGHFGVIPATRVLPSYMSVIWQGLSAP
jgi:hypothetical protein